MKTHKIIVNLFAVTGALSLLWVLSNIISAISLLGASPLALVEQWFVATGFVNEAPAYYDYNKVFEFMLYVAYIGAFPLLYKYLEARNKATKAIA